MASGTRFHETFHSPPNTSSGLPVRQGECVGIRLLDRGPGIERGLQGETIEHSLEPMLK
jgi:hypothetical protein